ncbi:hypothetical protein H6G36_25505 [Anabaena minutissima FACHB-250]|nr:hypothetical protein [Anabaena minutissima FACHB-250]
MIVEIHKLLLNFAEQEPDIDIFGLRLYPGEPTEWVIEDSTTNLGVVQSGEGLGACLKYLKSHTQNREYGDHPSPAATLYDCWQKYAPLHQSLHPHSSDCYPCLVFDSDGWVIIEDCDADFDFSGDMEKAIALLQLCLALQMSITEASKIK